MLRLPVWMQVLRTHPPHAYLAVSVLPAAWLPWLCSLPLRTLCVEEDLDPVRKLLQYKLRMVLRCVGLAGYCRCRNTCGCTCFSCNIQCPAH